VRWYLDGRSGAEAFASGHVPGAVFVDLDRWLAAHADPRHGRHPLPEPDVFARGMSESGIGDEATVIAYDDAGGVTAARLVWMLRATGHDAALLDGGIAAVAARETGAVTPAPAPFTARPWPADRLAGIDEFMHHMAADISGAASHQDRHDHASIGGISLSGLRDRAPQKRAANDLGYSGYS